MKADAGLGRPPARKVLEAMESASPVLLRLSVIAFIVALLFVLAGLVDDAASARSGGADPGLAAAAISRQNVFELP